MRSVIAALVSLGVLWFALSGLTLPLILGLGAASVILCVWLGYRLGDVGRDRMLSALLPVRFAVYCVWLLAEIVKANLDVIKHILRPALSIDPVLVTVKADQVTDIGRVIHANSITLTPGTLSIEVTADEIEVHALTREAADELCGGEIGRRVNRCERGGQASNV
ncbi:MAG: Na+/H+ antiporter subunit E [Pseudomonadota bacterium]